MTKLDGYNQQKKRDKTHIDTDKKRSNSIPGPAPGKILIKIIRQNEFTQLLESHGSVRVNLKGQTAFP